MVANRSLTGAAGLSRPAPRNSPNGTDRGKTRARNTGPGPEPQGEPDGTDSRRVCRCRFIVAACLVRRRCVGMPCGRTRLQRICRRLRHRRRQAFRVAAVRAPQPAAGLHTCVVPSRWFAHHLDRTRNGHVLALAVAKRTLHGRGARLLQRVPSGASCPNALLLWRCFSAHNYQRACGRASWTSDRPLVDQGHSTSAQPFAPHGWLKVLKTAGERYAEFRQGDRMAEYGLTALIVGG